jgi:hypothetical protein
MELAQLRLIGPVVAIKKSTFEKVERVSLDFAIPDAGGGFKSVRIALDNDKAAAGDKRHQAAEYDVGVVVDLPVVATVNFKTNALGFRIADVPAEVARENTRHKPSFAALKGESSGGSKTAA